MALKKFSLNRDSAVRYAVAAAGGLLLCAAFPNIGIAGFAWIAPALILFSALGSGPGQAFRIGFAGGLAHFLGSLYWLLNIPYTFHGVPLAPALGWVSLSAYCSLYFGAWVWLCWRSFPKNVQRLPFVAATDGFLSESGWRRAVWAFSCGAIWVGLEIMRGRFLSGFPWNFLGVSQYRMLPMIQIASVTGVYGVSFLVAWMAVSLGMALLRLARKPGPSRSLWAEAGLPLLAATLAAGWGAGKLMMNPPQAGELAGELKVALVQPSIPQTLIWDPKADAIRFHSVLKLSETALASHPDVLIWPESALPVVSHEDQAMLTAFVVSNHVWMILCGDDEEQSGNGAPEYFNSSFLVSPDGVVESIYHKRRLVIFGEYIPLLKWLPFLKWVSPVEGGFTPGTNAVQFETKNPLARISTLICFEDMFPQEARTHVQGDTDFLVNLTNDGWFGEGAEQWQQTAGAVFRAVENGVPLVRCTNNGVTCWTDAFGRIREVFGAAANIYGPGFMIVKIPLRHEGVDSRTIYNRYGDWFGWGCGAITILLILRQFRGKTRVNGMVTA